MGLFLKGKIMPNNQDLKVHVIIPTRGDRPDFVLFAQKQMEGQTRKPDFIEVVDFPPQSGRCDIASRTKKGILNRLEAGADVVFIIEDDDFYCSEYIETMVDMWIGAGKPALFGINFSVLYHLGLRAWGRQEHEGRASLYNTLISKDFNMDVWPKDPERFVDLKIWKSKINKKSAVPCPKILSLGIKHGQGMCGGSMHAPERFVRTTRGTKNSDDNLEYLQQITGLGFWFYKCIINNDFEGTTMKKSNLLDKKQLPLIILNAIYSSRRRSVNVTDVLNSKIKDGALSLIANNELAGDPDHGKKKKLIIRYVLNGKTRKISVPEGEYLSIASHDPIPSTKKEELFSPCLLLNQAVEREERIVKKERPSYFTDIIIPTYNNNEYTIACFNSIRKYTKKDTYRIIWVDNGSEQVDDVIKILKGCDSIKILISENLGFVGAVNKGLLVSDAPNVCLLNNDTEVSPRWLEKLNNALCNNSKMGIVGALTGPPAIKQRYDSHHNIAYQQRARKMPVFPYYKNLIDFNKKIEEQLSGVIGKVDFVAFLCAVIKREVINKVGLLDTRFDMGMWDDCDYNRSVKKAGFTVGLSLDTCIIHHGRATFKELQKMENFDVDKLVKKNKKILDKKWKAVGGY